MIQISIYQDSQKKCVGFRSKGHADYADSGKDIICSAVSILVISTINAIETYSEDEFHVDSDEGEGIIEFRLDRQPSHEAELLLNAMILGLESMASNDNYSKYIYVDFEEVQQL